MKYGMISTGSKEASEAAQEILKLGQKKKIPVFPVTCQKNNGSVGR